MLQWLALEELLADQGATDERPWFNKRIKSLRYQLRSSDVVKTHGTFHRLILMCQRKNKPAMARLAKSVWRELSEFALRRYGHQAIADAILSVCPPEKININIADESFRRPRRKHV